MKTPDDKASGSREGAKRIEEEKCIVATSYTQAMHQVKYEDLKQLYWHFEELITPVIMLICLSK